MKDGNSDEKLVSFLKQYRPNVPDSPPDLEQRVLAAIDQSEVSTIELNYLGWLPFRWSSKRSEIVSFPKWVFPSAIAASLLVFVSGYRVLVTAQFHPDETPQLEAFMVNNWEDVLNYRGENWLDRPPTDLFNFALTADSEPLTNN